MASASKVDEAGEQEVKKVIGCLGGMDFFMCASTTAATGDRTGLGWTQAGSSCVVQVLSSASTSE